MKDAPSGTESALPETQGSSERSDPNSFRRRSRLRRIVFIVLALFLIGFPLVRFWRQAHARYIVVGKADPVTGYRCVFTVSQGWKRTTPTPPFPTTNKELVEADQFVPPTPSAMQTWINAHIFHRTPPAKSQLSGLNMVGTIQMYVLHEATIQQGLVEDSQGYLSVKSWPPPPQIHILQQEHLQISRQPATWWIISMQFPPSRLYECALLVKPLHQPTLFEMVGMTDNEAQYKDILQEMTAIRDSLRIEKLPIQGRK